MGCETKARFRENGQSLIMYVFLMMILILFVGLGIDLGFAYVTRANLSKAVDAACLSGIRSFPSGTITASALASSMFKANYGQPGRDTGSITPNIRWGKDDGNNTILDVDATATMNTFFIRLLPTWKTLSVKSKAESTRMNVIMSLVLDWSGSMFTRPPDGSGGALDGNLTSAVNTFIEKFDDDSDRASMSTFGSFAQVNVSMRYNFTTPIENAEKNLSNLGRTFSQGGLTNGFQQIQSVSLNTGEKVLKVIVFFTDGFANTFQDNFSGCGVRNLGQGDPFNSPANGPWGYDPMNPNNGNTLSCGASSFYSVGGNLGGTIYNAGTVTISSNNQNIWREGQLRALETANAARNAGILIYSIGLGTDPARINQTFLKQIANVNDPSNPTFNSDQPSGDAVFAPTAEDLQTAFETIANKILLRLTK